MGLKQQQVTILSGQTNSASFEIPGVVVGIFCPTCDVANLSMQTTLDNATWFTYSSASGVPYVVGVGATAFYMPPALPSSTALNIGWIVANLKYRLVSSATQGADRVFTIMYQTSDSPGLY